MCFLPSTPPPAVAATASPGNTGNADEGTPPRATESKTLGIYGGGNVIVNDLGQVTGPLCLVFLT